MPDDGRSISRNVASLNILVHDVINLLYYNTNSYLFVNGTEIHKFKAKNSEIIAAPICLGNISRGFTVDNMKKTRLNEYVYDFSVDYNAIANDKILDKSISL